MTFDKSALRRLGPALEARKERDAARFRETRAAVEALDAEIEALEQAMASAGLGLDPQDLKASAAFVTYRDATQARLAVMRSRREGLLAEEATARRALARSYGELEGVNKLLSRPDAARRGV